MKYKMSEKQRRQHQEWGKEYYKKNKEKISQWQRVYHKKYYEKNRERITQYQREYVKKRRENSFSYRFNSSMSTAVWRAVKDNKAGRKWETLVGYTLQDLIKHLEKQFDENMNWNNHGSYWQIDHCKPISLFNFKTAEDSEFKECWALSNLQPLEAMANLRKSNRYRE